MNLVETDEKGNIRVKLSSVARDGRANKELIDVLSKHYKVNRSKIRILKGKTSKDKLIEVDI